MRTLRLFCRRLRVPTVIRPERRMVSWSRRLVLAVVGMVAFEVTDRVRVASGATTYEHGLPRATWGWTVCFVGAAVFNAVVIGEIATRLQVGEAPVAGRDRSAVGACGTYLAAWTLSFALPFERGWAVGFSLVALVATGWASFEGTLSGLCIGVAMSTAGPVVEALCVSQRVFHYAEPLRHVWNVPAWLPVLYFSVGIAVVQLTRAVNHALRADR